MSRDEVMKFLITGLVGGFVGAFFGGFGFG
jgi:hypothetical protein